MTYDIHPVAELFPLIEGEAFSALVADIKANGLLEPIEYQGNTIIDGRNRLRACEAAGVVPEYRELPKSVDPVKHILQRNIHRRHLTTAQRAAIAAELATMERGTNRYQAKVEGQNCPSSADALSIDQAADLLSVSPRSVKTAKARMKDDPEAHAAVKRGEKPKKQKEDDDVGSKNRTYQTIGKVAKTEHSRITGRVMGPQWIGDHLKPLILEKAAWSRTHNWAKEITEDQAEDIREIIGEFVRQQAHDADDAMAAPKESIYSMIDSAKAEAEEVRQEISAPEKTKLERAIKAHQRLMDLQFERRVKEHMDEILKLYAEEYDRYKAFNDAYSGAFTDEEYRLLISVLHPDRCQPERAKQFAKAFHLVKSKEEILCRVKQNDRPTSLPSTLEDLMARKKRH